MTSLERAEPDGEDGVVMARNVVHKAVEPIRELVDSLRPPIAFRKLHGVLNALEMQVEDGRYDRRAVARLCEALLATAALYAIDEEKAGRLEVLVCKVVELVERRG